MTKESMSILCEYVCVCGGCTHGLNLVLLLVHSGHSHSAVLPRIMGVAGHHHTTLDGHTQHTVTNKYKSADCWERKQVKFY